jgi:hypothetical protein
MVFAPTDMTETERSTNSVDSFAAMREVDTHKPSQNELRRMMSERWRG